VVLLSIPFTAESSVKEQLTQPHVVGHPILPTEETLSPDLQNIIRVESGGRTTAKNPHSSAYGLFQLTIGNRSTLAHLCASNANTEDYDKQVCMGKLYIYQRYGTPEKAWAFWQSHGWY